MAQIARTPVEGYTSGMARPADPGETSPPAPGGSRGRGEHAEPTETFGPLIVTRHVKDDGRSLLLYTLSHGAEDETEAEERRA